MQVIFSMLKVTEVVLMHMTIGVNLSSPFKKERPEISRASSE